MWFGFGAGSQLACVAQHGCSCWPSCDCLLTAGLTAMPSTSSYSLNHEIMLFARRPRWLLPGLLCFVLSLASFKYYRWGWRCEPPLGNNLILLRSAFKCGFKFWYKLVSLIPCLSWERAERSIVLSTPGEKAWGSIQECEAVNQWPEEKISRDLRVKDSSCSLFEVV